MIVYLNGKLINSEQASISIFDGGYLYGDGLFETIRLYSGKPFDLDGHLSRLSNQLDKLNYDWMPDLAEIRNIIQQLVIKNSLQGKNARCRLTVSRSGTANNPLPLSNYESIKPTVSIFLLPLTKDIEENQKNGIFVKAMKSGFSRGNFPGLKTLNYLPTVVALRAAHIVGCQEALLLDSNNNVLEAATSNVFAIQNDTLITPPVEMGLLSGRTRSLIIKAANSINLRFYEKAITLDELIKCSEVFLSGSVKEIMPVIKIDDNQIGNGKPGSYSKRLLKKYRQRVLETIGDI